jgi:hypothetical protein
VIFTGTPDPATMWLDANVASSNLKCKAKARIQFSKGFNCLPTASSTPYFPPVGRVNPLAERPIDSHRHATAKNTAAAVPADDMQISFDATAFAPNLCNDR